jgi:hypothetical protein
MTTCTGFLPTEASTLEALWDQEDEWWQYLYLLSDRFIEDGDEDGGRFLQWLVGWRVRPSNVEFAGETRGWWWWTSRDTDVRKWRAANSFQNPESGPLCALPNRFASVCTGSANYAKMLSTNFQSAVEAIEAAMDCWKGFTEKQKVELEGTWKL